MLKKATNFVVVLPLVSSSLVLHPLTAIAADSPTVSAAVSNVRVGTETNLNLSISNFDSTKSFQVTVKLVDASNLDVTNGTISANVFGSETNISGYNSASGGKFSGAKIGFKGTYAEIVQSLATVTWTASSVADVKMRVAIATAPATNEFFDGNTGHYYRYVSTTATWSTAASNSNSATLYGLKGYLANITTKAENEFIARETSAPNIWFGMTDGISPATEGRWQYIYGPTSEKNIVYNTYSSAEQLNSATPSSSLSGYGYQSWYSDGYMGWASGEPNNWGGSEDCAVTNWSGGSGRWNDLSCSNSNAYLIEFGGRSDDSFTGQNATVDLTLTATNSALKPSNSVIPSIDSVTSIGSTVTASDGTWASNGASITGTSYKWQYGDGTGSWTDIPTNDGTVITNQTLIIPRSIAGYKIRVQVSKTNSVGTSDPTSSQASAGTVTGVPLTATLDSLTPSSGSLSVALTHGNSGGSTITSIKYSLSTNGSTWGSDVTVNSASSPFTISGLTNGTLYYVKVLSVNGVGPSASYSNVLSATVGQKPDAPTGLSMVADDDAFTLKFTASTTYGWAVTGYEYSTDSGSTWKSLTGLTSPQTISTASDNTSLSADTSYTVLLRAKSAVGDSSSSASVSATFRNEIAFSSSNFVTGGTSGYPASFISNITGTTDGYRLTPASTNRYGTVWNASRLDLREDFVINAQVHLGSTDGADGMAFVLQPASTSSGSSGGGLGYMGINNSLAVEFDTYFNNPGDSTSADHITYIANGAAGTSSAHTALVTPYEVELEDGTWRSVRFTWIASTKTFITDFETTDNGPLVQILSKSNLDLASASYINSNFAYWGFTAATGGAVNLQQVIIDPYTVALRSNASPSVTSISDTTISSTVTSNNISIAFSDDSSTAAQISVTASSSDQTIVADSDIAESVSSATAGVISITPKGVSGSTTITVRVTDADGASTSRTFVLTVFGAPSVPRNVGTTINGTTATVSWSAPLTDGGSNLARYIAYATPTSGSTLNCATLRSGGTAPARTCDITGLVDGMRYTVTVYAENSDLGALSARTSSASSSVAFVVPALAKVDTPGTVPARITRTAPSKFVGNISESAKTALINAGVVTAPAGAPIVSVSSDLQNSSFDVPTSATLAETVTSGSEINLKVLPPSNTPIGTTFRGYLELLDGTLVDLGDFTLTNTHLTSGAGPDAFTIVPIGTYKIYLYLGSRVNGASYNQAMNTQTLSIQPAAFFIPAAAPPSRGQVEVTYDLTVVAGAGGVPVLESPSTPSPTPTSTASSTPTPTPTRSSARPTPEPTTSLLTPQPSAEPSVIAAPTPQPSIDERGLEVIDPAADAPEEVAETTVTAVTLVAAVTAAASAATAVAAAAGAAASAGAAAAGSAGSASGGSSGGSRSSGGSSSGGSSSGSAGGKDPNSEEEGEGSVANIDFDHSGLELAAVAWGDGLRIWRYYIATLLDKFSHDATIKTAPVTPLVSKLISDGAYLRSMFGILAALLPASGIALGLIGLTQTGGQVLPPSALVVTLIAAIGVFDAMAGFLAMAVFSVGLAITTGLGSAADIRMMLGLFIVGFGPALLAGAFRGIRKPASNSSHEWWERVVDLAVAPFLGGWAMQGMVGALPALAGVKLPIADSANTIALVVAGSLIVRVILEELTAQLFPSRLNFIHPTNIPAPHNLQKVIALAMRAAIFWFVAGAFIGNSWHLYVGTFFFIFPSYLGMLQDRFPNYPKLYQILPAGLPGLAFTLLVASYSLTGLTAVLGATPDLAKIAFVVLPIPSVILSILGMLGREPLEGDVRWYQRQNLTWLYRLGGIAMLAYTMHLTGII